MTLESSNPKRLGHSSTEGEKLQQKQLDREVRDMVSAITNRLTGSRRQIGDGVDEDERGSSVITLAGSNTGATMKSDLDEMSSDPHKVSMGEGMGAYVNSNFQAINNSIMLGGSYSSSDPGVHLEMSDSVDQREEHKGPEKQGRKGRKKERGNSSKTDHQLSDDDSRSGDGEA
ncbi:PREDICTED: uncharacterized protein LOC104593134 [Nelumbo nucifera]|uniref:Uncharacterized protein n=2 Tax=Nelumbo nucifera TaxID=4432 RepID=A0A822Z3J0_NELNU|nr:PREDICTED: uncharacterized protein LOC104593134 [Nelumbo nucifera]DAD36078.1 TPA_asm: hypothetical protein HUJ06_006718 [Nelumbo nucifera]